MLYKNATNFNGLKVFGSLCYASTLSTKKKKIQGHQMCFLLVLKGGKWCILLNIQSRVSKDVVFYENVFPYQRVQDTSNETNNPNIHDQILFTQDQPVLSQPSQAICAL